MKLYSESKNYKLYEGNMLDMLEVIEPNSIDAIVTDPPYELNFMNKGWDNSGIAFQKETWEKCLKVLKPGGYLLAFGGSRTFHRIACAIEDAGFEIRDTIMWLYGSGFPKSMNIGLAIDTKNGVESLDTGIASPNARPNSTKDNTLMRHGMVGKDFNIKKAQNEWDGWGTQLKPAYESITLARKPCEGTCVDNVMKYGVGGINIDECRVPTDDVLTHGGNLGVNSGDTRTGKALGMFQEGTLNTFEQNPNGRFPANVILTYDETDYEEVCGGMPYTKSTGGSGEASVVNNFKNTYNGGWKPDKDAAHLGGLGDEGSAARYFYCAKASKRDRDEGLPNGQHNIHPTLKPLSLMQYLVRLVTPKGGTVLDPFNGSGSTGKACMWENKERSANYKYIGIELTPEYLPISKARIDYVEQADSIQELEIKSKSAMKSTTNNTSAGIKLFDLPQG